MRNQHRFIINVSIAVISNLLLSLLSTTYAQETTKQPTAVVFLNKKGEAIGEGWAIENFKNVAKIKISEFDTTWIDAMIGFPIKLSTNDISDPSGVESSDVPSDSTNFLDLTLRRGKETRHTILMQQSFLSQFKALTDRFDDNTLQQQQKAKNQRRLAGQTIYVAEDLGMTYVNNDFYANSVKLLGESERFDNVVFAPTYAWGGEDFADQLASLYANLTTATPSAKTHMPADVDELLRMLLLPDSWQLTMGPVGVSDQHCPAADKGNFFCKQGETQDINFHYSIIDWRGCDINAGPYGDYDKPKFYVDFGTDYSTKTDADLRIIEENGCVKGFLTNQIKERTVQHRTSLLIDVKIGQNGAPQFLISFGDVTKEDNGSGLRFFGQLHNDATFTGKMLHGISTQEYPVTKKSLTLAGDFILKPQFVHDPAKQ